MLVRLYKIYIQSIIEYGSLSFLAAPKQHITQLDKIQNEALRVCLHLPSYIRTPLLHEYGSIMTIQERLRALSNKLLSKMTTHSPDVKKLVDNYNADENAFKSSKTPLEALFCLCK